MAITLVPLEQTML